MKIVVSTFNNSKNNYGALFQSCGLSSFLTKLNHDVSHVTVEQRKQRRQSKVVIAKTLLKKVLLLPHARGFKLREQKFRKFARETQNQIVYKTQEELFENPPVADVYLSGSDQVWNPVAMHEDLFLAYAPKGSKKISYAASMGSENIPKENKARFAELIGEFETISVREDTVVDIVKPFTDHTVYQHIDPVFLKTRSEWEELETPYENLKFQKYILAYIIEWNAEFNAQLKELKARTKLPVVSINLGNIKKVCADQVLYDVSPNEFLYLLHHAEMMIATSFHGVAMSVVFNKPFVPFVGTNMPTRIQSLMRHFDIDVRESVNYGAKEFERINDRIRQDQIAAREYLENCIK